MLPDPHTWTVREVELQHIFMYEIYGSMKSEAGFRRHVLGVVKPLERKGDLF